MPDELALFTASAVAPMDRPLIRDGGVVVSRGHIVAVGDAHQLARDHPRAATQDLGCVVLLPGLVNAHVHLELSALESVPHSGHFGDWIISLRSRIRALGDELDEVVRRGVRRGLEQCARFGITAVGDIAQQSHTVRPMLAAATIRGVSYGETLGLAKLTPRFEELLQRAVSQPAPERFRVGISPHAPYTVDLDGYRKCLSIAVERKLPLATHLAEVADEEDFLMRHEGVFREIWETIGEWSDDVSTFPASPILFAHAIGLLDYPALLAHVNFCEDAALELLARGQASVVYCPRTHAYFGHPPHRWREMLDRGINVAVGTDSCASSPDLNLADDLRVLRRLAPEIPAETIWRMGTINGARAIGLTDEIGTLSPGKYADIVAFPATTGDALEAILNEPVLPACVIFEGVMI